MTKIVLFDEKTTRVQLLPLTYTRAVAEIRIGTLTIKEKWERYYDQILIATEDYLHHKSQITDNEEYLYIDASTCPEKELIAELNKLSSSESLIYNGSTIAFRGTIDDLENDNYKLFKSTKHQSNSLIKINNRAEIFIKNGLALTSDFKILTTGRESSKLDPSCTHIGNKLFIEKGAKLRACILNSESGPIYISKNAEIMEGSILKGPISIGENSTVKMGAKIYGDTSIGPHCKVGGEIGNSVIFGYSNKGHDGYLGNSVIGEWCNLGADTNTSNLKNNYGKIKTWDYSTGKLQDTGLIFHGLVMGDHSKSSINTMFNTGTIIGVSANIYGGGFPEKFIPSFSWGGSDGMQEYRLEKAIETAKAVYLRRSKELSSKEQGILSHTFSITSKYRT